MINVSFNELAVTSELPAPRTNPRPVDVSAFSKMLDNADTRPDLPTNGDSRDSRAETRAEPAERASAPDAPRQDNQPPHDVSSQEDMSKRPTMVAETDSPNSPTRSNADDSTKNIPQKANEPDTAEEPPQDDKQPTANAAVAVPFILPPVILAEATPSLGLANTVPVVAPLAAGDTAPAPQDEGAVLPPPLSGLRAPTSAAPNTSPSPSPADEMDRPTAAAPRATDAAAPSIPAAVAGKVMSETLFAVTALSQEVTPEPEVATLPTAALQTTPLPTPLAASRKAPLNNAIATQPADLSTPENAPTLDVAPQGLPTARVDVTASPPKAAVSPTASQQVKDLTGFLALNGGEITFIPAPMPPPTNPTPALANGMVSQISAALSAEGQAKTASAPDPTVAASDITATPNATFAQTAMAVAGAVMPQATNDEPQPKFTATADGLTINAPGPVGNSHATYASAVDAANSHKSPIGTPAVVDQVAVHVAKAAAEGIDKINIKLKPASLGQIEVQLEIASDGRIHAVIAADKPETLDLLQRDARALERALGDAGLRTDSSSLSFNLRGQNQQYDGSANNFAGFNGGVTESAVSDNMTIGDVGHIGAYLNSRAAAGGVDISV